MGNTEINTLMVPCLIKSNISDRKFRHSNWLIWASLDSNGVAWKETSREQTGDHHEKHKEILNKA